MNYKSNIGVLPNDSWHYPVSPEVLLSINLYFFAYWETHTALRVAVGDIYLC